MELEREDRRKQNVALWRMRATSRSSETWRAEEQGVMNREIKEQNNNGWQKDGLHLKTDI